MWLVGLALAQSIPTVAVAPFAGYVSDRGRRRDYLIAADIARAGILVGIVFTRSLPLIVVGAAFMAICSSIFRPIEAALEADLLAREDITRANALRVSASQLLSVAGPALAGAALIWLPASRVLLIDALSFVISALTIATLPNDKGSAALLVAKSKESGGSQGSVGEGIAYIAGRTDLRTLFFVAAVATALLSVQNPLFYGFVQQTLLKDGPVYGLFISALGAGGLLAALLLTKKRGNISLVLLLATLCFDGLSLLAFTYSRNIALSALLMAALGAIGSVFAIAIRSYLQMNTAPNVRGRVIGWFVGLQSPIETVSLTAGLFVATRLPAWFMLRAAAFAELVVAVAAFVGIRLWGIRAIRPDL